MFFLIIFLCLFLLILNLNINIKIIKNEKLIIIVCIFGITVYDSSVRKKVKKRSNNKLKKFLEYSKFFDAFFYLLKQVSLKTIKLNFFISNTDYIKGSYFIALSNYLNYYLKNISNYTEVTCEYKSNENFIDLKLYLEIELKIYKIIITFAKLIIILLKVKKKGRIEYGKSSNRKFNGNCNVIN